MGTTELSATRVRNQKRRAGYKRRAKFGRNYESGGSVVKTWEEGYTDAKWRAECEQRSMNLKEKVMEALKRNKANLKQVGGDHYKNMGVEPWDVVDTWPIEQRIGAYRHGALKYLMRMGSKDENAQEVGKGIHYMEKLLEVVKEAYNDGAR